jgi:signal transduction histidine kinase/CheY-like chemotaxis protein
VRDATGAVQRLEGIILDVTERKRAEAERAVLEQSLRHAEKLRVIGQLTGGIAHDFNNLLGGISGHAEMLQRQVMRSPDAFDDRMRSGIASIRNAAERAAGITAQLRIFSRRDDLVAVPTDIHRLIRETVELIGRTMPSYIRVRHDLHAEQYVVLGDAALIQTALVNLAINARDAMPQGGVITLRTEVVSLVGDIEGALNFDLKPGPYIKVLVEDTGVGMDATIRARLFEPFFTTKELGKGTGLGLASVFGCVKSHRGAITVASEVGKGSEFGIYLPLAMDMQEVIQPPPSPVDHRGDGGTIMVVDDDLVLRNLAAEVLRDHGYAVMECEGVKEAEAFFQDHASAVDLVIMDMIMPGADGHEGIARLRAIDPGIPVVVCSGAFPGEPAHAIESADGFLQKPYQLRQLVQIVATTKRVHGERPSEG